MLQEEIRIREGMSRLRDRVIGAVLGDVEEPAAERHWVVASFGRRVAAQVIDGIGLPAGFVTGGVGMFFMLRAYSNIDETVLVAAVGTTTVLLYLWWWVAALSTAQTPGKRLLGLETARVSGQKVGVTFMFVREFILKALLLGALAYFSFGVSFAVDNLWPLWDRSGRKQTLHDKLLGTVVIKAEGRAGKHDWMS